jgi:hypothetical protein
MTQQQDNYQREIVEAMAVLDRHLIALNASDATALADTLHFPHYRLAGMRMRVWQTPETYFSDFLARAGEGWHHTRWDFRNVISASRDKVHIDLQFTRFRADDSALGSFRSIWVITSIAGKWAAQLRSSFAG